MTPGDLTLVDRAALARDHAILAKQRKLAALPASIDCHEQAVALQQRRGRIDQTRQDPR
jgi:hypothetical protein